MRWRMAVVLLSMLLWLGGCGGKSSTGSDKQKGDKITITATLPGGTQMEMVWITPGTFLMGSPASDPDAYHEEYPQHQVTISKGFYLGKYEITQGQWQAVMGTVPWSGQTYVQSNPNNPAAYISWDDMQAFVHKLNQTAGDSLYRLPTEVEWEYAYRAGTTTRWPFGDDEGPLGEYAWYDQNVREPFVYGHRVGGKLPNPWGLYDMPGNVWEWCQDWYGAYSGSSQTDPTGPPSGSTRVLRGGNFYDYAQYARSAHRGDYSPVYSDFRFGARLLRIK